MRGSWVLTGSWVDRDLLCDSCAAPTSSHADGINTYRKDSFMKVLLISMFASLWLILGCVTDGRDQAPDETASEETGQVEQGICWDCQSEPICNGGCPMGTRYVAGQGCQALFIVKVAPYPIRPGPCVANCQCDNYCDFIFGDYGYCY
jgi:hypothetical protein